jgi:predicted dehydrogenase
VLRDLLSLGAAVQVAAPTESTRKYALEQGARAAHADVGDIRDVDGYVIVAPTSLHAWMIDRLLPTGKPIFVEKPLCIDPADARRIADRGQGRVFVMDKWRYHPGIQRIADLKKRGELGEVLSVRMVRMGWGLRHRDMDSLSMLLPHDLSILLHVIGDIPMLRSAIRTTVSPGDGGMIAVLGGDAGAPLVTLETSVATPEHRRSFTFVGERATAQLADACETCVRLRRGPPGNLSAAAESLDASGPLPLLRELEVFVEHLRGGPAPVSSANEGRRVVERIAEIRQMLGLGK